jgi:hypothetical protein
MLTRGCKCHLYNQRHRRRTPHRREQVEAKREPERPKVEPAVKVEISEGGKSASAGRPPPKAVEHEVAQKKSEHAQAAQAAGKRGASKGGSQGLMS